MGSIGIPGPQNTTRSDPTHKDGRKLWCDHKRKLNKTWLLYRNLEETFFWIVIIIFFFAIKRQSNTWSAVHCLISTAKLRINGRIPHTLICENIMYPIMSWNEETVVFHIPSEPESTQITSSNRVSSQVSLQGKQKYYFPSNTTIIITILSKNSFFQNYLYKIWILRFLYLP